MSIKIMLKQYVKMFSQNCLLPLWYRRYSGQKTDPGLVVFADAHHDQRPENMELLYRYLTEKPEMKECFRIRELYMDYQNESPAKVLRSMKAFMKSYAEAGTVVLCDNFLPAASCRKKEETNVIQLWHACGAFKKFGYDTSDDIPKNYHGNVFCNTDLVTVSAEACEKPFASAMRLPQQNVKALGVSRTDRYFHEEWRAACRKNFERLYPEAKGKKLVLWAPTFRGNPGDPGQAALDVEGLQKALGEEWLVLVRVHPHMQKKYGEQNCRIVTEELFPVVDLLIADYSSLIYEYLLFEKPLLLYVPDFEEYCSSRGFYMKFEEIPARRIDREYELAEAVCEEHEAFIRQDSRKEERDQFLRTYMGSCDGHATERIAAYITEHSRK